MRCITSRDIALVMQYDINTIDELIDELGGGSAVGRWLGITPEAVSMWKARGNIAPGWHMRLAAAVGRKGKTINPEVFGMTEDEAKGLLFTAA